MSEAATTTGTFSALKVRNFRLYFIGQLISVSGTWMQSLAQAWLVLKLTDSGVDLGIAVALQFLPMLVLGSWGGLIVDRSRKRRMLFFTQGAAGILAFGLGVLTQFGHVTIWTVFGFALALGVVNLFDNPARQTFVQEMVGRELLTNAVSLNSVLMNSGRVIGPAIAGGVIAAVGIPACFFLNALSFVAVIIALAMMDPTALRPIRTVTKAPGQLRQGFAYAAHDETIRSVLIAVGIIGIFAFNFTVTLPLLIRQTFHGSASTYGVAMAAMGAGAVVGGLLVARRSRPSARMLSLLCLGFGAMIVAVALSPTTTVALIFLVPMGAASIAFVATANATLQMASREEMRGRVMSLYAIGFLGSTPIGAPLVGLICAASNPRIGLLVGGVATLGTTIPLGFAARRARALSLPDLATQA